MVPARGPHRVARLTVRDLDSYGMGVPAPTVETWLRPLVESSPDGILVVVDLTIQYANLAAATLCGKANAEALIGWPLVAFFHPESHARIRGRIDGALGGERPMQGKIAPVRVDVRTEEASFDLELSVCGLGEGQASAVGVILHDVTERHRTEAQLRASEERLRLAFAGAKEGVWDWDLDTGHVVYSRRWKEMLGYGGDEIPST